MASTYLTRTFSSAGNRKTWTMSAWIKRSGLKASSEDRVFGWKSGGGNYGFQFDNDAFRFYVCSGGSGAEFLTNRKFRDTSGWYHIVASCDTTQATQSDRFKLYINGVQETSFATGTYPNQNEDTAVNQAEVCRLGCSTVAVNSHFSGLMSHVYFIDGTALPASTFGSTDSTTGEWKINTSPTISSYGTNGFLVLKDGNTITDQSPNSNNFTLGAGTLTKTEDNPSNVFATMNPLAGSISDYTLSNGNTSFQNTSGWSWKPSTICPSKGKFYYEVKMTGSAPLYEVVGVVPFASWDKIDNETIGAGSGGEAESVGYSKSGNVIKGNSTVYSGTSYTVGDIVCVAVDLDNRKIYFRKNGGSWENSGDPTSGSTGTGAVSLSTTLDDWSLSTSASGTDAGSSINYGNGCFGTTQLTGTTYQGSGNLGIFKYQPPSGYTALCTKGLNE